MDKVFHPNERAWISEPFKLDQAFEKLTETVATFLSFSNATAQPGPVEEATVIEEEDPKEINNEATLTVSQSLSNYLGGDNFFKVKIRDDEMYTNYNYGAVEESHVNVNNSCVGKELVLFNEIDYEEQLSEWSLDEDFEDDEMDPEWRIFGKQKLEEVVATYHNASMAANNDTEIISESEGEESDINVISESEDEELVGPGSGNIGSDTPAPAPALSTPSSSKKQSPVKQQQDDAVVDNCDEFKDFNSWGFKITKQKLEKLEAHQLQKLKSLSGNAKLDYMTMLQQINPQLACVPGETFQDDPVKANSSMPVLASPISKRAKTTLQTLAIYISHQDDPTGFHWKSSTVQQQINEDIRKASKHNTQIPNSSELPAEDTEKMFVDMQKDFVVTVSFFHPKDKDNAAVDGIHKQSKSKEEPEIIVGGRSRRRDAPGQKAESIGGSSRYLEPKLAMTLTLLSTNTLADLRAALRCENDLVILEEVQHPKDYVESEFNSKTVKALFPSGMILIGDVIYGDNRSKTAKEYSDVINLWAESYPKKDVGPFKYDDLDTTQIKDLTLRFGYPYVYVHQGSCEHIVVFNLARKLHSKDYNLRSVYPYIEGQIVFKTVNCRVDNEYIARWAVLDCDRFPENPMLVCTQCLENYCYDPDGNKIGSFSLYPFKQVANTA